MVKACILLFSQLVKFHCENFKGTPLIKAVEETIAWTKPCHFNLGEQNNGSTRVYSLVHTFIDEWITQIGYLNEFRNRLLLVWKIHCLFEGRNKLTKTLKRILKLYNTSPICDAKEM